MQELSIAVEVFFGVADRKVLNTHLDDMTAQCPSPQMSGNQ